VKRGGAQHHACGPVRQEKTDGVHSPDPAANLDRDRHRLKDGLDLGQVSRLAFDRPVQVHDMEQTGAQLLPL
jgi:hypothetical protein